MILLKLLQLTDSVMQETHIFENNSTMNKWNILWISKANVNLLGMNMGIWWRKKERNLTPDWTTKLIWREAKLKAEFEGEKKQRQTSLKHDMKRNLVEKFINLDVLVSIA